MADGAIDVDVDGLRELGTGLTTLADTLGSALEAVDAVPIDAVAPVVGPVGADDIVDVLFPETPRAPLVTVIPASASGRRSRSRRKTSTNWPSQRPKSWAVRAWSRAKTLSPTLTMSAKDMGFRRPNACRP